MERLTTIPTRRAILTAAVAAPAIAAIGITAAHAAPTNAVATVSPDLARLLLDNRTAHDSINRFYADVWNPICERYDAARAAVPHVTIPPSPRWRMDPAFWSTNSEQGMAMAKRLVAAEPRTSTRDDVICARKLMAASHRRDRLLQRLEQATGMAAADARQERMWVPITDTHKAIEQFPTRSLADLAAKLAFIKDAGEPDGDALMAIVEADVARLAAREA